MGESAWDDRSAVEERRGLRRARMVGHRAASHEAAEAWDLEFWQAQTPEERLSALVAIRREVELVEASRPPEDRWQVLDRRKRE